MKYQVLYIDPPWSYKNKNTGGTMKSGANAKYPTLTTQDLCNLPIKEISEKDSVLYMWATVPLMVECLQVFNSWGFTYKTMITWNKQGQNGLGYWYRGQCEHILFGIRGKVKAFRIQEPNFIQCKVEKHSKKPEVFRRLIERSTPNLPRKLEIFSRERVEKWDAIGNDIDGLDIRESLNNIINKNIS